MARHATRYYHRVDRQTAKTLDKAFHELREEPIRNRRVVPLKGRPGEYRYRTDGVRIVFTVDKADMIVTVLRIGPRGDIYKS